MSESEKSSFAKRLHEAASIAGIPERGRMQRLADLVGVSKTAARNWLDGEAIPKRDRWNEVATKLGVSMSWLFLGKTERDLINAGEALRRWRKQQDPRVPLTKLSSRLGIPLLRLAAIEEGKATPDLNELERIESATGLDLIFERSRQQMESFERRVSLEHMLEKFNADGVVIPIFADVEAAAGDGAIQPDIVVPGELLHVSHEWVRETIHAPADRLAVIRVRGDSMAPTLADGDWIFVDMRPIDPGAIADGVYVFAVGEELYVKRLQRTPDGIIAISDNPAYERFSVDLARLVIHARVVYALAGRRL